MFNGYKTDFPLRFRDPFKSYTEYRLTHDKKGNGGSGGPNGGCAAAIVAVMVFFIAGAAAQAADGGSLMVFILVFFGLLFLISLLLTGIFDPKGISSLFGKRPEASVRGKQTPAEEHAGGAVNVFFKKREKKSGCKSVSEAEPKIKQYENSGEWFAEVKERSRIASSANPHWEEGRYFDLMRLAGSRYQLTDEELDGLISVNDRIELMRESDNLHDKNAIAVYTRDERKIGYLPQKRNPLASALMDSGTQLFGRVLAKAFCEERLHVAIEIYIKE